MLGDLLSEVKSCVGWGNFSERTFFYQLQDEHGFLALPRSSRFSLVYSSKFPKILHFAVSFANCAAFTILVTLFGTHGDPDVYCCSQNGALFLLWKFFFSLGCSFWEGEMSVWIFASSELPKLSWWFLSAESISKKRKACCFVNRQKHQLDSKKSFK